MVRKSAWFLNFDADDELARPSGYTPSRAVLARSRELREKAQKLVLPGDLILEDGQSGRFYNEYFGMAWCPTPRAQRALRQAGAIVLPSPPLEVLCAVNSRRFNAALGQTLPGARYALELGEVEEIVAGASPTGQWLLKRPFGFAGRGRLRFDPRRDGERAQARPWIEASMRGGEGIQVEPLVERVGDFALHGYVDSEGALSLGEPTKQTCDETGAWIGSERAAHGDLSIEELGALFEETRLAGSSLSGAGYFGPFGVDAFRWKDERGERRFNPRCEINARYSMGWAIGMGELRPDREVEESDLP